MTDPSVASGPAKDLLIAEFGNLRQEQFSRTNVQQAIAGLNFTTAMALGGVAASQFAAGTAASLLTAAMLLAIVPTASIIFGIAYYEQHRSILMIGEYIHDVLAPQAKMLAGGDTFQWEDFIRTYERGSSFTASILVGTPILIYGTSLLSLVASAPLVLVRLGHPWLVVTWVAELAATVALIAAWILRRGGHLRPLWATARVSGRAGRRTP
ncbi:hypothetical protein [Couchioplanes azureus]|uniref:hypothetical protein n=1 Tax=Couchioplanes caeruleus TaxID=56438 RepID=UPI0016716730|nr:hypothetical protein [Couchioplanes caeruleus]GGQ75579.1 hypothetical protein GCM10010166_52020 [Couchioplanes caeruleus subsp. azureus]